MFLYAESGDLFMCLLPLEPAIFREQALDEEPRLARRGHRP